MNFSLLNLRTRLLLLVLIASLPGLGLVLYTAAEHRHMAAADAQEGALRLARLAAADQEQLIEGTRQVLVTLAELPVVKQRRGLACNAFLAQMLRGYQFLSNLAAADRQGNIFCSGVPTVGQPYIADRPHFSHALATGELSSSGYLADRITGDASLVLAYPFRDDAGAIQGVVLGSLNLEWLNRLAANAQLPPGAVLSAIDQNGVFLARYPASADWIGRADPRPDLVQTILATGEGVTDVIGLDGEMRIYGYSRLPGIPGAGDVYVRVGLPKNLAYAAANRALARNLGGLILVSILALAVTRWYADRSVVQPVQALAQAAERLKAGDLSARSGLTGTGGEMEQLAAAFDQMAVALQGQQTELRAAESRYRSLVEHIPAVIFTSLPNGLGIRYISPQIEQLSGFPPEAWMADPGFWLERLHPEDRDQFVTNLRQAQATNQPLIAEYRLLARDGRTVWVRDEAHPVSSEDGTKERQGVVLDITDARRPKTRNGRSGRWRRRCGTQQSR